MQVAFGLIWTTHGDDRYVMPTFSLWNCTFCPLAGENKKVAYIDNSQRTQAKSHHAEENNDSEKAMIICQVKSKNKV